MGEGPATVRARNRKTRHYAAVAAAAVIGAGLAVGATVTGANAAPSTVSRTQTSSASSWITSGTATPIKHVVVIFDENVSFDHYFGTYPFAANTDGSTFHAKRGTPRVNGLYSKITPSGPIGPLLTANPNLYNPQRLTHAQAATCDQDHGYTHEQQAVNGGRMDKFVEFTESASTCAAGRPSSSSRVWSWTTTTATRSPGCGITRRTTRWATTTWTPPSARPRPVRSISSQARPAAVSRSARPTGSEGAGPGFRQRAEQRGSAPSTATSTPPTMTAPTTATPR